MSNCNHENLTIDRYCNDCGYDLIVDDRNDAIRQRERERIIKLLEQASLDFEQYDFNAVGTTNGLIALIKEEK